MDIEVKIPFGLHVASGLMIHVSQADRGQDCGCVCAECGGPLIARKGPERADHFAHKASNPNCVTAPETSLHRMAKQLLAGGGRLLLPALFARAPDGYRHHVPAERGGMVLLSGARVEPRDVLEGVVPDVYGFLADGTPLAIEIRVAHPVPLEKIVRLAELGIMTVEIILTHFPRMGDERPLRRAVQRAADRLWLFHPRQAEIDAALAEEIETERREREEQGRDAAELRAQVHAQEVAYAAEMAAIREQAQLREMGERRIRALKRLDTPRELPPIEPRQPPSHWAAWSETVPSYPCAGCRGARWWSRNAPDKSMPGQRAWICSRCHPPLPHLSITASPAAAIGHGSASAHP